MEDSKAAETGERVGLTDEHKAATEALAMCSLAGCSAKLPTRTPLRLGYAVLAVAVVVLLLFYTQSDGADHWQHSPIELASSNIVHSGYLVWSRSCKIPDKDPFDDSIRGFLKSVPPIKCNAWPPLTYTQRVDEEGDARGTDTSNYVLGVHQDLVEKYVPDGKNLTCCYSNVTRVTERAGVKYTKQADNHFRISSCVIFEKEVKLKPQEEFILVRCSSYINEQPNTTKEVYLNMHGVVPIKPSVAEKRKEIKASDGRFLNVLMVGFDSMSRLNLLRTMPQTVEYLRRVGYIDLQGYNKIGDNTFPNLMAILTGYNMSQIRSKCCANNRFIKIDDCPFVWKDFHNQSYVSVYAEDEPTSGTFNYQKTGFLNQPTDYYFRPYMLVASKKLKKKERHYMDVCMGPQTTSDHILKYAIDFLITFKKYRFFALFWLNNFSHGDVNDPAPMDSRALQFFNEINETGIHNNSIVIFFSDHGMRFGGIRNTYIGWLEERLPFIYILVPPWFKNKYPKAYQNFLVNRNKLTSPFDLHATLKDIIDRALNQKSKMGNVALACPKCKSVFADKIGDRSCEDAGITPHWCTCAQFKEISVNDTIVRNAAQYALSEINTKFTNLTAPNLCADLNMSRIIKANVRVHVKTVDHDEYDMTFETEPGGGLFETTVRRELHGKKRFSIIGPVSRINVYANQSYCVDDAELKLYCFCNANSIS